MKKFNLAHVPAEERQSPGGKYVKTIKEIPDSGKWAVSKESAGYIFAQGRLSQGRGMIRNVKHQITTRAAIA